MRTQRYIVLAALLALPLLTKAQDIAISHLKYNAHTCAREGYIGTQTDIQNATIHAISIFDEPTTSTMDFEQPFYNLSGQRVDPATYHGIVIHAGHTHFLP